jgi:hypothetical protein
MTGKPKPVGGGFSAPAAALVPVAGQVNKVKHKAEIGGLKLDPAAAKLLIATLTRLHARVDTLVKSSGDLDEPLKFGQNFVGQTVAGRLRDTASGGSAAVTPVLTEFSRVLGDLQATVQAAAGSYVVTDEEAALRMQRAAQRFGLEADV